MASVTRIALCMLAVLSAHAIDGRRVRTGVYSVRGVVRLGAGDSLVSRPRRLTIVPRARTPD
jgi:hypothetical protein